MTDVFISYRREDGPKAEAMARALQEEGLSVWWDAGLQAGELFDAKIQSLLREAKAVLLIWSPAAIESEWVRGEGTIGRERGILVPVMVKDCSIPVPFNLIHTADLTHWNGDRSDPAFRNVVGRLKELAAKTDMAPLKPPPNRAMRRLWRTLAVVALVAAAGASLWVFRPWEPLIAQSDPVYKARQARIAAFKRLEAFGISEADVNVMDWKALVTRRFKPETIGKLTALADSGDTLAQALLCAVRYWGAPPVEVNDQLAWTNCRRSAEGGDPVGQTWYGYLNRDKGNDAASAEWMGKAAEQGFAWGQLEYGARLENGVGVAGDVLEALALYRAAQAQGLPHADFALGFAYIAGVGVERDGAEGVRLLQRAADAGLPMAVYELAAFYHEGGIVPRDLDRARELYRQAAAQTDDAALADRAENAIKRLEADVAAAATPPESALPEPAPPQPAPPPPAP